MEMQESAGYELQSTSADCEMDLDISEFETCGICSDAVIDRGVLDCCEHWFCFSCIDNWAAITNRCPLCRSEFRLITCIPVFQSIVNNKEEENSYSGVEDEWHVEGEHNTLSFPSYYIDEDAVTCLDSGGCKIRSGEEKDETDIAFDTSIACDSCDKWYHALCVGYNPECASQESWFCPGCVSSELPEKLDVTRKTSAVGTVVDKGCNVGVSSDAVVSTVPSICFADDGETAVVVSFGGWTKSSESSKIECSTSVPPGVVTSLERSETIVHGFKDDHMLPFDQHSQVNNTQPDAGLPGNLFYSPIREPYLAPIELPYTSPLHVPFDIQNAMREEGPCSTDLIKRGSESVQIEFTNITLTKDQLDGVPSLGTQDKLDGSSCLGSTDQPGVSILDTRDQSDGVPRSGDKVEPPAKKQKLDPGPVYIPLGRNNALPHSKSYSSSKTHITKLEYVEEEEPVQVDIMSIVEDTPIDKKSDSLAADGEKRDKTSIRIKKIVRRKEESSALVQEIQKEIRSVVGDTNSIVFGLDSSSDEKLLAAFRVAIGKPVDAQPKKLDTSHVRARKSLLQKGTIRENLTKRLYGSTSGRRRSAWHRDWEVEFWKYRCRSSRKPEKIKTLQSVLELLRKTDLDIGSLQRQQERDASTSNALLSRVYLADASVMPRGDDLKPLSDVSACSLLGKNGQHNNLKAKDPILEKKTQTQVSSLHSRDAPAKSDLTARSSNNKPSESQKEANPRSDKKKWALEVLARRTAAASASSKDCKEDSALKGNYPLLAQLPAEMKPVISETRNKSVSAAVRQAQLYRITEYFLKRANLPAMRRCAETELAIADAINVEKDIVERSSSKMVYTNLCAQVLRQHTKQGTVSANVKQAESVVVDGVNTAAASSEETGKSTEAPDSAASVVFSNVEEALELAGLSSDSPPRSSEGEDPLAGSIATVEAGSSKLSEVKEQTSNDHVEEALELAGLSCDSPPRSSEREDALTGSTATVEAGSSKSEVKEQTSNVHGFSKPEVGVIGLTDNSSDGALEPNTDDSCNPTQAEGVQIRHGSTDETKNGAELKDVSSKKTENASDEPAQGSAEISKKVEAYVKEHIRPLCKSGVITVEQYRWAVKKTTEKVASYHRKAKDASFLIKEGEKVKKLALEYVEAASKRG